jgi:hypothetical protein
LPASGRIEDWFFDYDKGAMMKGVKLLPSHSHPLDQSTPGPAERVPANWQSLLHQLVLTISNENFQVILWYSSIRSCPKIESRPPRGEGR